MLLLTYRINRNRKYCILICMPWVLQYLRLTKYCAEFQVLACVIDIAFSSLLMLVERYSQDLFHLLLDCLCCGYRKHVLHNCLRLYLRPKPCKGWHGISKTIAGVDNLHWSIIWYWNSKSLACHTTCKCYLIAKCISVAPFCIVMLDCIVVIVNNSYNLLPVDQFVRVDILVRIIIW